MSNVIPLQRTVSRPVPGAARAALIEGFARFRRLPEDVFWLKENAELLGILGCTGGALGDAALDPHRAFYAQAERWLEFFPQYYRFVLSICTDLEALGMAGTKAGALADRVLRMGLVAGELSDLQRLEARRLMARHGIDPLPGDTGLEHRVHRFIAASRGFAIPNPRAAYELTHVVFYLSDYGRRDPHLPAGAAVSLEYAGLLAYLDQNVDLLAEICIAMRHAKLTPSPIWEGWVQSELHRFDIRCDGTDGVADEYHPYLVCNWLLALTGHPAFTARIESGPVRFHRARPHVGPLRDMSVCMFQMQGARSDDWHRMRPRVEQALTEIGQDILAEACRSTDRFEEFFAGFARAASGAGAV
ncbi:DUF6902 family protein [Sedimentitalea nanhaiensis]|uniref:Uncharacterized protein n=1 Tax=Sedimentitalea nanhaiensis TaxID=999627 RepID=A0A1I7ALQ6_9RHOB|nr:hypothetical protein [Sedimentitalea nanhaiensis]SFT75836.1 hypothetical protein SAMN05216236_10743 [Sedimentitalea nanhaiensis]